MLPLYSRPRQCTRKPRKVHCTFTRKQKVIIKATVRNEKTRILFSMYMGVYSEIHLHDLGRRWHFLINAASSMTAYASAFPINLQEFTLFPVRCSFRHHKAQHRNYSGQCRPANGRPETTWQAACNPGTVVSELVLIVTLIVYINIRTEIPNILSSAIWPQKFPFIWSLLYM